MGSFIRFWTLTYAWLGATLYCAISVMELISENKDVVVLGSGTAIIISLISFVAFTKFTQKHSKWFE